MRIGELANQTGFSVETIRYFENEGLIEQPQREHNGYRRYADIQVQQLHLIQSARSLGFSTLQVRKLLSLTIARANTCQEVYELTKIQLRDVKEKMLELEKVRRALEQLINACEHNESAQCPTLEILKKDSVRA